MNGDYKKLWELSSDTSTYQHLFEYASEAISNVVTDVYASPYFEIYYHFLILHSFVRVDAEFQVPLAAGNYATLVKFAEPGQEVNLHFGKRDQGESLFVLSEGMLLPRC